MEDTVGVGLIGFGSGTGVLRLLQDPPPALRRRPKLVIRRIAVRDMAKVRPVTLEPGLLTDEAMAVIQDPTVQMVVEVTGAGGAYHWVRAALEAGKDVVTANKALLAEKGSELFALAAATGAELMFEASVAGSIPVIRALRSGLVANRVDSLYGILNGTTNYMLTRMSRGAGDYADVLAEAQEKGYAEPDPTMDVSGMDAAQKLAILCRIAFQCDCRGSDMFCEGIEGIEARDINYAKDLGYAVKLLAIAKRRQDGIEARVHPTMVPVASLMANIHDEFNAVEVVGDAAGNQVFYGRGAGQMPTASSVVADMADLAQLRASGARSSVGELLVAAGGAKVLPMEQIEIRCYLRLSVLDQPGVLKQVTRVLADENISIASIIQQERDLQGGVVPLVMVCHEAPQGAMDRALANIEALDEVAGKGVLIRMEEML